MTPTGTVATLYSFQGAADGAEPRYITLGRDGHLYGTTRLGGAFGCGTIFRLTADAIQSTLHHLACGSADASSLLSAPDGTLFGTTYGGGTFRNGTVFELTSAGGFRTLYSFTGLTDGAHPSSLLYGSDGNLYGSTLYTGGGGSSAGAVFRLSTDGNLAILRSSAGQSFTALIQASDGNLYGAKNWEIFRMSTDGDYATLYALVSDGGQPLLPQSLTEVGGVLVVTTRRDLGSEPMGDPGMGTIFSVTRDGQHTLLWNSTTTAAPLTQGRDGRLYGLGLVSAGTEAAFRMSVPALVPATLRLTIDGQPHDWSVGLSAGVPTIWTVEAQTQIPLEYKFLILSDVGWRVVQDYSPNPTLSWTPARAGRDVLQVWMRTAGSAAAWEAYRTTGYFDVVPPAVPVTVTSFVASPAVPAQVGTSMTWYAAAIGGIAPLQYQFWLLEPGTGWRNLQSWSAANWASWTPHVAGSYAIQVWVRSAGSTAAFEAWSGIGPFGVSDGPLTVVSVNPDRSLPVGPGAAVTWTGTVAGGDGSPLEYQFFRYNQAQTSWTIVQPYSASPGWTWVPGGGDTGRYWLQVWVRRQGFSPALEAWGASEPFEITSAALSVTLTSTQGNPPNVPAGTPIRWQATASGATSPLEYLYWRLDGQSGTWTLVQPYGPNDAYSWTPTVDQAGYWLLQVWARPVGSVQPWAAWASTGYFIIQP
jgi:uncharacterized repeat protein (TIGR03803 family)